MSTKYKEKLKELLVDDDEFERLENRKILDKINFDRTIIDKETYEIKLLDLSQGILMYCSRCGSIQPVTFRRGWTTRKDKKFLTDIWIHCDGCSFPIDVDLFFNKSEKETEELIKQGGN